MATKRQTLKQIGGSVATVLPKSMLERFNLEAGDEVTIVETDQGLLVTPYDPEFDQAMQHFAQISRRYRNALRELAK
jgi:putative addiction module antidote